MFKGFYNLTSGMLTQGRHLDVIANNMTNVSTAGYKSDEYTASTFDQVMFDRVGNKEKIYTDIGNISYIRANSEVYTDHTQGLLEQTDLPLDFAIEGEGYFGVRMEDGTTAYTRNGSFSLDEEGYLCLPGKGRVLGAGDQPIRLVTDDINADAQGALRTTDGIYLGRLVTYNFAPEDVAQFERNDQGLFITDAQPVEGQNVIHHRMIERSNVDLTKQMVDMITCQRALQSAAQLTKMYDQLMSQSTEQVGRM